MLGDDKILFLRLDNGLSTLSTVVHITENLLVETRAHCKVLVDINQRQHQDRPCQVIIAVKSDKVLYCLDTSQTSTGTSRLTEPEKNFPGIFQLVEILLEWMESLKRGKSAVLRKLGRTETGYFSRRSQSLPTVLPTN